ncbi:putative amp dependent CoA ligase [Ophiobolus disseminans]|uniref:Putative amp dependent CoA ligase n=1 Tax=Ophiobolus disseminans TaxID=1469910 RepID=A0A6A6ZSX4_9PLEO|nr:putative amp dependent CoA ligase [Ophiobolus disseminans]
MDVLRSATFTAASAPPLPELNIGQLLDAQYDLYPNRVAAISRWQRKRVTYRDLHTECQNIALSLLVQGVHPRDHVVVLAGNSIEYMQLFFAVGAIGAVFSIINPTFTADEVIAAVDFLDPAAIFVAGRIGYRKNDDLLASLAQTRTRDSLVVRLSTSERPHVDGLKTWDEFLNVPSDHDHRSLLTQFWAASHPDDTLCVQFTSGTTGLRKAAMLSHQNLLGNAWVVGHRLGYTQDEVVCCCVPLSHCFGLVCGILGSVMHGCTVVIPFDIFLSGASLEALSQERCTVIFAVATMFQAMLDHPDAKKYSHEICLRTGIVAGSTLSLTLLQRLKNEFALTGLAYAYGMTEASGVVFMTDPSQDSLLDDHVSVGTLLPHSFAKVVDDDLKTLNSGVAGELLLAGYLNFKGYYKTQSKTNEALFTDLDGRQWLRTGDLVTINAAGRCIVTGRVKDMIKRGGENIFPSDIEKVLEENPGIETAACIGIPDDHWGEIVGVFIKRACQTETAELGTKEIKFWLRHKVAPHKVPEHYFWLGDGAGVPNELPCNHTGKLLKGELRTIASNLLQQKRQC